MSRVKTWWHLMRKGISPTLAWYYSRMPMFKGYHK